MAIIDRIRCCRLAGNWIGIFSSSLTLRWLPWLESAYCRQSYAYSLHLRNGTANKRSGQKSLLWSCAELCCRTLPAELSVKTNILLYFKKQHPSRSKETNYSFTSPPSNSRCLTYPLHSIRILVFLFFRTWLFSSQERINEQTIIPKYLFNIYLVSNSRVNRRKLI